MTPTPKTVLKRPSDIGEILRHFWREYNGLKTYGIMGVVLAGGVAMSAADKATNYTPKPAVVTSSKIDCYIEDRKSKVVEKKHRQTCLYGL